MYTVINGTEYTLAVNLRVAYMVQSFNNHAPYAEVFKNIGNMHVEEQIDILYASFVCGNPEAKFQITREVFREYYLDKFTLKDLMSQLEGVVHGIMGEDTTTDIPADAGADAEPVKEDDTSGNV